MNVTRMRPSQHGAGPAKRAKGPIDPRLVKRAAATRPFLAGMVLVGGLGAFLTIAQAWWLSQAISDVFYNRKLDLVVAAIPVLVAVFAGKALLAWLNNVLAHRAAASVKSQLRVDIMRARLNRPLDSSTSTSGLVTLVTQGLDALDGFYSKYLPQLVLAVIVPVVIGVAVFTQDFVSTLIAVLTLPLIPFFMYLVGLNTQARTKKRWALQTRLAKHFSDLVEGLPTLQVFGRARAQLAGLKRTEGAHRKETMATLRISFLSALVLELLATLSVAIIAVTIGFTVAFGHMDLTKALFILILAPEIYLPVRQVGVHYHDSADGMAAAQSAFSFIDSDGPAARETTLSPASGALIEVEGMGHTYAGSDSPAVSGISFTVTPGQFAVLTGPSGGGKTTVLNAICGFLTPTEGVVRTPAREALAYVGQNPGMLNGTVADNVRLGFPAATDAQVRAALDDAGAPELTLDHPVGDDAQGVSAGERRRIATARALLRIRLGGATVLLLDEPTAGLDASAEAQLLSGLRGTGVAAVVVSHRPAVIDQADITLHIGQEVSR